MIAACDLLTRIEVCKVSDLPPGQMKGAGEGEKKVLVANIGGKFYAMRSICNHEGGPLEDGPLFENEVTCPWHGSVWDVTTGKCTWFGEPLNDEPVYKVTVEEETVFVEA